MRLHPPIAILSARRSGALSLYRLLAPALHGRAVGGEPFHWDNAWGEVSRRFHEGTADAARTALEARLADGSCFHHRYDAESWDFNAMLLDALARAGYRLLVIEREPSIEHLFSILLTEHLGCRDAAAIARLRARMQAGEPVEAPPAETARELVRRQWHTHEWFGQALAACSAPRQMCRYDDLFLRGVAGLAAVDEVFRFAGIGSRQALIDDASLLRFLFGGHHYTAGLAAYSPAWRLLREQIAAELAALQNPAPAAPATPDAAA